MKNEKTEQTLFSEVVEAMPSGVVVFERAHGDDGNLFLKILVANDNFCEIVGVERDRLLDGGFIDIFPGCKEWKRDVQGALLSNELDGTAFIEAEEYVGPPVRKWINIRAFITAGGNPVMIVEDVTSQSRTKQALQRQRSHITF